MIHAGRLLLPHVLTPLLAVLAACSSGPDDPIAAAQAALDANRPKEARIHAMNAVKASPDDGAARLVHARAMLALGDGAAALNSLQHVPDSLLNQGRRREMHAEALLQQNENAAVQALLADSEPATMTPEMLRLLALSHARTGTLWEHRDLLREGLSRDPENPGLLAILGQLMLRHGDIDRASDAARRGYAIAPDDRELLILNGQVAIAQGQLRRSQAYYLKAAEIYPDDAIPIANVIGLDLDLGETAKAKARLAQALLRFPDFPFLQFQRARLAYAEGDLRAARDALTLVTAGLPDYAPGRFLSGQVALDEGRREFAIAELGRALALDPGNADAASMLERLRS